MYQSFLSFCLLLLMPALLHAGDIVVLGLFQDQAIITINGARHHLRVGEQTPEGAQLLKADAKAAVISYQGKHQTLSLGQHIDTQYKTPMQKSVQIIRDNQGMYRVDGQINRVSMRFLVDTGATLVAMNEAHAKAIGLMDYKKNQASSVNTASGQTMAYPVVLDLVEIGAIAVHNVKAMVIEGGYPKDVLLGLSFLNALEMDNNHAMLELTQQF